MVVEGGGEVGHEGWSLLVGDRDVLDYVLGTEAGLVQGVVHDASVHVVVQEPASDAVEGGEEVVVSVAGYPETATVVAEEVVCYGDCFCDGGGAVSHETFDVDVEPGVVGTGEVLDFCVGWNFVGEASNADDTEGLGIHDPIQVVV